MKYTLATRLVNELVEASDEKVLAKTITRYGRVDLLCTIAIASNESFSGWTKTFTDPRPEALGERPCGH